MTTAKAWRQKGTGRARVGALSVPHRRGGGVAFGPKPRHHTFKVNRKARRRALRSALSVHAARGTSRCSTAAAFDEPATKQAAEALAKWGPGGPTLVVVDAEEAAAVKSFRNLPAVTVLPASAVGRRRRDRPRLAGRLAGGAPTRSRPAAAEVSGGGAAAEGW